MHQQQAEKLFTAMVLLEIANKMHPHIDHFFSKYQLSDLIDACHDLIQNVHSNGQSQINDSTLEVLATFQAADRYMELGGHRHKEKIFKPSNVSASNMPQSLFKRLLSVFKK